MVFAACTDTRGSQENAHQTILHEGLSSDGQHLEERAPEVCETPRHKRIKDCWRAENELRIVGARHKRIKDCWRAENELRIVGARSRDNNQELN
jgi:hypothetical protein